MKYVVDCSTAVQWQVPEPDSLKAVALRDGYAAGQDELLAPDIFPAAAKPSYRPRVIAGPFGVTNDQGFVLAFAGYGRIRADAV